MELKLAFSASTFTVNANTFNRTAYGIEMNSHTAAKTAIVLLIAPLMELKCRLRKMYRMHEALLIAPLMELKYVIDENDIIVYITF